MCSFIGALLVLAPAAPASALQATQTAQPGQTAVADPFRADVIRADVELLASDGFAGRSTGTTQAVEAARWLATQLQQAGVQPAYGAQGYLQQVPLCRTNPGSVELTLITAEGEKLQPKYGVDFDHVEVERSVGPLRVQRVLSELDLPGTPDPKVALLFTGSVSMRRLMLEKAGTPRGEGWGAVLSFGPESVGKPDKLPDGRGPIELAEGGPAPAPRLRVRGPLRERFLSGELTEVEIRAETKLEELEAFNVVGVIRGTGDAARGIRAEETIVLSAHYDHLGVNEQPVPPPVSAGGAAGADGSQAAVLDVIYNGADDDASGCAAVLALARQYGRKQPPVRTLVFFLATGEEVGLLGTRWYVDHPLVPLADTVLNLNFEMIGRPDPLVGGAGILWLTGFERSNLGPQWKQDGLPIEPDKRPDQNFFERSDNMAFAVKGIVAQTLSSYNLHKDYHRVDDEADRLDYAHMEIALRTAARALALVADGTLRPEWSPNGAPRQR